MKTTVNSTAGGKDGKAAGLRAKEIRHGGLHFGRMASRELRESKR